VCSAVHCQHDGFRILAAQCLCDRGVRRKRDIMAWSVPEALVYLLWAQEHAYFPFDCNLRLDSSRATSGSHSV
jgi:hypothetical protein